MSVLDPRELQASPLADLHALAAELGLEGFRRLRKDDLIKQIVQAQGGSVDEPEAPSGDGEAGDPEISLHEDAAAEAQRASGDYSAPGSSVADEDVHEGATAEVPRDYQEPMPNWEQEPADEGDAGPEAPADEEAGERELAGEREEDMRRGILDVLPNGSGFIRAEPYRQSREDVYVSPAQIRRCELRPGDEVEGPVRPPRRNERHPSLVRVATVNGQDADSPSERARFNSLRAAWPSERLAGPNVLADYPFGKGSRVAIGGPPGAGATYLLREAVKVLRDRHSEIDVLVVLAGVRPEEAADWNDVGVEVAGGSYDGSSDEQAQVAELAVQRAKRAVESGKDVVVVVDSLDALPPSSARRVFGAGRNAQDGGSLTVLASTGTAAEPHRMATTHITLEPREGEQPRVAPGSGTLRRDLLG
ncbi:MAG TPA: Rho termination factor N-terminal domain-containing protein [Thermoleophilaceae bacterium]|nr:Rho termination factor N-terminal domain-containing protein [Thermoleophilaceae bacterium]